jgi:hypothetical protein
MTTNPQLIGDSMLLAATSDFSTMHIATLALGVAQHD